MKKDKAMTPEQKEDISGIQHPDKWPVWPSLPLKRHVGNRLEAGFLLDNAPLNEPRLRFPAKMYFGNIWRLNEVGYLENLKSKEYASAEAIIEDGWEVD